MIAGAILLALAGGLWRRAFGGWLGLSRVALTVVGVVMAVVPSVLVLPWWQALVVGVCFAWLWTDGHDFYPATWRKLGYRYLGPAATLGALVGAPVLIVVGPLVFGGYWLAERYWPRSWRIGGFIDGHTSVGEIAAGVVVYGVLAAHLLLN